MSKLVMSVSVCTALLAASAAVSGAYAANQDVSATKRVKYAYAALQDGRNQVAIKSYSTAIESRKLETPTLGRALLNRALAFQKTGRYKQAIADYSAAISLDALSAKMRAVALYNRGLANEKANLPAMAIEDFTNALFLVPDLAQAFYSRANVLRKHGQYLFAISDYQKARAYKHPQPYLTYFGEALTYEALGKMDQARLLLLKASAANPKFSAARVKLTRLGKIAPLPKKIAASKPNKKIQIAVTNKVVAPVSLVTGSINPGQSDLTIGKTDLPKAVSVPARFKRSSVVASAPVGRKLKIAKVAIPIVAPVKSKPVAKVAVRDTSKPMGLVVQPAKKGVTKVSVSEAPLNDVVTSASSGWTVQLSSQRNSKAAWDAWANLTVKHARILNRQKAVVVKADLGKKGIYYRLRVHQLGSKQQAARLCSKLKRRGTSCFISRT